MVFAFNKFCLLFLLERKFLIDIMKWLTILILNLIYFLMRYIFSLFDAAQLNINLYSIAYEYIPNYSMTWIFKLCDPKIHAAKSWTNAKSVMLQTIIINLNKFSRMPITLSWRRIYKVNRRRLIIDSSQEDDHLFILRV